MGDAIYLVFYLPFSRGVPRWGQLFAMAKILPSRSAATSKARPSTSTGTRSPAAMSLDLSTATHSSCETKEYRIKFRSLVFCSFRWGVKRLSNFLLLIYLLDDSLHTHGKLHATRDICACDRWGLTMTGS